MSQIRSAAEYGISKQILVKHLYRYSGREVAIKDLAFETIKNNQGLTSDMKELVVTFVDQFVNPQDADKNENSIRFIVKAAKTDVTQTELQVLIRQNLQEWETNVYSTLDEFIRANNKSKLDQLIPRYVGSGHTCGDVCVNENGARQSEQNSGEFLVLEKLEHFTSLKTGDKLDLPHMIMAIEGVAQLHATGHVIQQHYPSIAAKLQNPSNRKSPLQQMLNMVIVLGKHSLEKAGRFSEAESIGRFSSDDQLTEEIYRVYDAQSKQAVLLHSDFHSGNMMFRYETTENGHRTPKQFKMVDFQFSQLGNLVLDLFYLITSSTEKCPDQQTLQMLWTKYIDAFRRAIDELGHAADTDICWLSVEYILQQMKDIRISLVLAGCMYYKVKIETNSISAPVEQGTCSSSEVKGDLQSEHVHHGNEELEEKLLTVFDYYRNITGECI